MTEGEGKNTWRTDRYSPCPRREAGHYFAFLASIGYQLADIEQAFAGSVPYAGDTPPDEPLPGATDGDGQEHATEPGSFDEGSATDPGHCSRLEQSRWHQRHGTRDTGGRSLTRTRWWRLAAGMPSAPTQLRSTH
jgi:hypothetical protein